MSLGIVFKGPEGIVLAADSRVTLTAQIQAANAQNPQIPQNLLIPATYDNATKLLRVGTQKFVGAVTYGAGAIGQQEPRTAHSYMPEFESELTGANSGRLSVQDFAQRLSAFFMRQWQATMPANYQGVDLVFLVGGYDEGAPYGRVFEIHIPKDPTPKEWYGGQGQFGIVWGGQREFTDRLIQGFDPSLPSVAQQFLNLPNDQASALSEHLRRRLTAQIPFAFLPLQDCVDLVMFLIRTTIALQSWIVGVRGVGGAIDVATITRTDGFKTVQQKTILGER